MAAPGIPDHLNTTLSSTSRDSGRVLPPTPAHAPGAMPPTIAPGNGDLVVGGWSEAFIDKALRPGYTKAAWGKSFVQQARTLDAAIRHQLAGRAVIFGAFKSDTRTNDTFRYTQVGVIDAEAPLVGNAGVAEALAVDFNRRHAFLIFPTASSGKVIAKKNPNGYTRSRIEYQFSERVDGVERARALYRALGMASEMPVDPASHKPAQPWHGSTNRIEQPHINLNAEPVNIQWLAGYLIDEARAEMEREIAPKPPTLTPTGTRAEKYSAGARASILDDYYRVPAHAGQRHGAFVKMTADLYALQLGGWHGCENVDPMIWEAGRATERTDAEIRDAIKWARTHASPRPFEIPDTRPLRGVIQARAAATPTTPPTSQYECAQNPTPSALTLGEAGLYNLVCPEYTVIHANAVYHGIAEDFTAQLLAELLWWSVDKAQRMIDKTLRWNLISTLENELTADFDTKAIDNSLVSKNAVNSKRGRKTTHYCLTPHLADDMITRLLPDVVQEIMQPSDPGTIYAEEAEAAGVDNPAALEAITRATALTNEADEVAAEAERRALRIARQAQRYAEIDETPFAVDQLPSSVREARTMAIEALIASDPDKVWKHSELMWVAGTTRHNVGALIAKSDRIMPAEQPTLIPVMFDGRAPLLAMEAACKAQHGAPVAWIDREGRTIEGFGPKPPPSAVGGLINVGKKYLRRTVATPALTPIDRPEKTAHEPTEEGKQRAARSRMRGVILPRLRGCLLARGWKHIPGAYGYWERLGVGGIPDRRANTFDDMVNALMLDISWAQTQGDPTPAENTA